VRAGGGRWPGGYTGTSCPNPARAGNLSLVAQANPLFASGCSFPDLAALVLWRDTDAVRPRSPHPSPRERFMGGAVPLSEHEQRQLEQIEQALYSDYPKLAQSVRSQDPRVHYKRRVVEAAIGFVIGVGLLLAGVISKIIFVGVGGFLVMLACAMWALTSWRHMGGIVSGKGLGVARAEAAPARGQRGQRGRRPAARRRRGAREKSGLSFMERLEERWRRRQEGGR